MKKQRKQLIIWLFEHSQRIYTTMFKTHKCWDVTRNELLKYPNNTFGKHLGLFLLKNNFQLIPKVERHDCYHVLCNYKSRRRDRLAMPLLR